MNEYQTRVELRKQRDFSDLLNATFKFLKQNFKPLGKSLLLYAGPLLLISAIAGSLYQWNAQNATPATDVFNMFSQIFNAKYYIFIAFSVISNAMVISVTYAYIQVYIERDEEDTTPIENDMVWQVAKQNYFKVLGTLLLSSLIIGIGSLFFIIPGIYLGINLSILIITQYMEKITVFDAISRCFKLVRDEWWRTFAIVIVVFIIMYFISAIFGIPQMILTFIMTFNAASGGEPGVSSLLFNIIATATSFISAFIYVIPLVTIALQYFNLVEKKENPTLYNRIQNIGREY